MRGLQSYQFNSAPRNFSEGSIKHLENKETDNTPRQDQN